jgi:MiaB/RimO family radical SAM methylthiotransferase
VDGLLGTGSYTDIVSAIEEVMEGHRPERYGDINVTDDDGLRILTTEPYFAYLKIAEGCNNWCAFCAIPAIRGRYRSRKLENLLEEAKYLSEQGIQELILIAQDVTSYGTDLYGRHALPELLRELCKLDFHWIRLHYLYPSDLTDEMIDVMASEPKIVHYFDMPLQHCNDEILSVMHRRGTKAELIAKLDAVRAKIPDAVFRTSLITGLPGEDEARMLETVRKIAALRPDQVKLHLLHVLRGTRLGEMYLSGEYSPMEREDYIRTVVRALELLPPDTVIGRLTGDGMGEMLLAPDWSRRKVSVINDIDKLMFAENTWQGMLFGGIAPHEGN